jgi:predicted TIM-barrel fold metal-dependent hydrolase
MTPQWNRRSFLQVAVGAVAFRLPAQTPQSPQSSWASPVIDAHFHFRATDAALQHMDGAGIARAVLLSGVAQDSAAATAPADRFTRFTSVDVARADAIDRLKQAAQAGTRGFGEMKSQVAADGPEMRRVYELAAEVGLPVMLHFQDYSDPASVGTFNTGIERLPALLKQYPRTIFIGHANSFWAHISADVPANVAYPTEPVRPGGLTDRMLSEFPNLYGDLSATSGRNALARSPEFSTEFLKRHQDKLIFGSDCGCRDGRGTGQTNPFPLVAGKCVARETLTALTQLSSPEIFHKITSQNVIRLLKLDRWQ